MAISGRFSNLAVAIFAATLLLTGVNTVLLICNQSIQEDVNESNIVAIAQIGSGLNSTRADILALGEATRADIEGRYGELNTLNRGDVLRQYKLSIRRRYQAGTERLGALGDGPIPSGRHRLDKRRC